MFFNCKYYNFKLGYWHLFQNIKIGTITMQDAGT